MRIILYMKRKTWSNNYAVHLQILGIKKNNHQHFKMGME